MEDSSRLSLIEMAADIVSAFVSNNAIPPASLPSLIDGVYASLQGLSGPAVEAIAPVQAPTPAVSIKKSISDEYLICLDDGKKFKSLRRHLAVLGMTPQQYREKWGLPADYPMVAPTYAAQRSVLARATGLGNNRTKAVASPAPELEPIAVEEPIAAEVPAPAKRRGRPLKKAA